MRLIKARFLLEANTKWEDKTYSNQQLKKMAAEFFAADILAMTEEALARLIDIEVIDEKAEEETKNIHP